MRLFGNTVSSLQKKSAGILDVFTKTVNQLTDVNNQLADLSVEKQAKIEKLDAEVKDITNTITNNYKVISNIRKVIG